ncbi:GntR family transcriptional regulator [Paenarthrobacter sp. NPDC089714]|uniref:GntR family transcriptional regulator n=1 Tax=Paenarthrobacter sp. NPDC089714 TaxID=3364377 RepID=UPI003807DA98
MSATSTLSKVSEDLAGMMKGQRFRTAHEYVLKTLRRAILTGSLPAGSRLVQQDVAAELDVSTTPVREALRDLAAEGLVMMDPHRGALVKALDVSEVREIYELRIALEPIMVRRVINEITEEHLAKAADLHRQMEATTDVATWTDLNRRFHSVFSEPDRESRLARILDGLSDSASVFVSLVLDSQLRSMTGANAEHARLIEVYRSRDVETAVELTVQHHKETLSKLEKAQTNGLM